jgi:nucleoside-diphosphate-sugar epimerase
MRTLTEVRRILSSPAAVIADERSPERRRAMNIEQKAVLVTGANRGIGQALVNEALRRGAKRVYAGTRRTPGLLSTTI